MKAPKRNCMYCHQDMAYAEVWTPPDTSIGYAGEPYYIYMCTPCRSQQDIEIDSGKLRHHNFRIGKYQLTFHPQSEWYPFYLSDCSDEVNGPESILELDFCPIHMTPKNTSEERIKLFLLFS